MNIFFLLASLMASLAATMFMLLELRRNLMMLQQNSYRNERYMRWLRSSGDSTSVMRLLAMAVILAGLSRLGNSVITVTLVFVLSVTGITKLLRARYKKPLVMTRRAWRIYTVSVIEGAALVAAGYFALGRGNDSVITIGLSALVVYCLSHALTMAANWLLKPVEAKINRSYINDAQRILRSMPDLKVVAITGSYGKTSTKHYLTRILSEKYDTVMTPGSFNTTMGVVRTIREYLKPYTEVFVVEMGAKQPGDIREICDIVHPEIGIVTAVGSQHLETFKTIENVQSTKFELVDSLPADGGFAVVNDDFQYIASRHVENVAVSRYAVNVEADYRITSIEYSAEGTEFEITTPVGQHLRFTTRLVGECNVSNLCAAIIVAMHMDVPVESIRYAVSHIEQVEHRLNMKKTSGGVVIIDDAYNSNPVGSAMALDVLARMRGGKRIVVTPGMIELGEKQYEANREFGRKIAASADVAIIVNEYNREAITEGIAQEKMDAASVRCAASFAEAQTILGSIVSRGDTVLYENDLPDTFK